MGQDVKESIESNGYFRRKSYRSIGILPVIVATVRAWSAARPNRLRGVLTLFAPTRLSLSWCLLLTVVTGLLGDTSVSPLAWRARCEYSLTIPLVALLRFTCLTPSVRPYYVPRCSPLLALVLPPPSKSMLLADREFSLRLATARVTSFLPCLFLSLSRPFYSSHVVSCEFLNYIWRKKRGLFTITKISVYRLGRFCEEKNVR